LVPPTPPMRLLSVCFAVMLGAQPALAGDPGMPTSAAEAAGIERDDALPITAFYDTPANLAAASPGDLLRQEPFFTDALPLGVKAERILYRSAAPDGSAVATSGIVLYPVGEPPAGGWPVIAWAHGTSGVARACAPSAMKDVYYGNDLFAMVKAGFAVVATDYHGLGTEGVHRYMDKAAQAEDVIASVPAARAAVPVLGRPWVVDGHSQGGLAAWGVAEAQARLKDPDYRGAIAVAGATHMPRLLTHPEETKGAGFYFAWHAFAVQARYPEFKPEDMLSAAGMAHYADATTNGCWLYGYASYLGVDDTAMLAPGWKANPWVEKFYRETTAGADPIGGPIFVIAGEADLSVPLAGIQETVAKACAGGQAVTFRSYPGLDHDPTMSESVPDQLAWIRDRLAGTPAPGNCPK
jgi:hypothetical protein